MNALKPFVLGGIILILSGCATITYDAATVDALVAMNQAAPTAGHERVGELNIERRAGFVIFDLITVMDADLDQHIGRELARTGGDAVINLRIHEIRGPIDVLISVAQSMFFLGGRILGTRTVTIRGDIIRWTEQIDGRTAGAVLEAMSDACRAVEIDEQSSDRRSGTVRTGHLCLGSTPASGTAPLP